jgi:hypothetical protein
MGQRTSPLSIKQKMAEQRERRILANTHRDDGFLRRTVLEPLTAADVRIASRMREVYISKWKASEHERFIRARLDPDAAAVREELLPMARRDLRNPATAGYYQDTDD